MQYKDIIQKTVDQLRRLPGVGEKTAERFAYFYLRAPKEEALRLSNYLKQMVEQTKVCSKCYNRTSEDPCYICTNTKRDSNQLCVVRGPLDILAIEKTGTYEGYYFVLGGIVDPANGIGPEELRFPQMINRIEELLTLSVENELELIFAFGPSIQSEATINYAKKRLEMNELEGVSIYKLAQGLPTGADLQYTDTGTLKRAFSGKVSVGFG
jgi:recombination protein RecR